MIKIYDTNRNYLCLLDDCIGNIHSTEELSTGQKSLCFTVPCLEQYIDIIQEENYVETEDYMYIIKEVNYTDNTFVQVFCSADIEEVKGTLYMVFDCFEKNIQQGYEYCLTRLPNWSINYHSEDRSKITYQLPQVSAYEMISMIAADYGQEVWYDTKNKVIHIYDEMGKQAGSYFSNELKLKQLKRQSNTYDYATVLYPVGKDGLMIGELNQGKDYITNFNYSNKYIEKLWVQPEIDRIEDLMEAARLYLDEISQPRASYELLASQITEAVGLGDKLTIVDKLKKIKQKQRVVKIIRYPNAPENDKVIVSNLKVDFADMWVKNMKQIQHQIDYIRGVMEALH